MSPQQVDASATRVLARHDGPVTYEDVSRLLEPMASAAPCPTHLVTSYAELSSGVNLVLGMQAVRLGVRPTAAITGTGFALMHIPHGLSDNDETNAIEAALAASAT